MSLRFAKGALEFEPEIISNLQSFRTLSYDFGVVLGSNSADYLLGFLFLAGVEF